MIDRTFIDRISEISEPNYKEIGDLIYSDKKMNLIEKETAGHLNVHTLQAVADYVKEQAEEGVSFVVNVESPTIVRLFGRLDTSHRSREQFIVSTCSYEEFRFGRYHDVEEFIVSLQSQFVQDDTTRAILKLVGNMTTRSDVGRMDDGISQAVEVKTGLANVDKVVLPNPVALAPYRTFPEVEQPYSNFVLRLKKEQTCALFEADGGAWKIEAIKNVADWLRIAIADEKVTILA